MYALGAVADTNPRSDAPRPIRGTPRNPPANSTPAPAPPPPIESIQVNGLPAVYKSLTQQMAEFIAGVQASPSGFLNSAPGAKTNPAAAVSAQISTICAGSGGALSECNSAGIAAAQSKYTALLAAALIGAAVPAGASGDCGGVPCGANYNPSGTPGMNVTPAGTPAVNVTPASSPAPAPAPAPPAQSTSFTPARSQAPASQPSQPASPVQNSVTAAPAPTITLQNLSRDQNEYFYPGDSWEITIEGAAPNTQISAQSSQNNLSLGSSVMGMTDANGNFTTSGVITSAQDGQWIETWYVGNQALPPLSFYVYDIAADAAAENAPPATDTSASDLTSSIAAASIPASSCPYFSLFGCSGIDTQLGSLPVGMATAAVIAAGAWFLFGGRRR